MGKKEERQDLRDGFCMNAWSMVVLLSAEYFPSGVLSLPVIFRVCTPTVLPVLGRSP